ncbi:hypothetical protein CN356_31540, partial [Bacillus cereus]
MWTILGDEKDELGHLVRQIDKGPIVLNEEAEILEAIHSLNNMLLGTITRENWKKPATTYNWENIAKDLEGKISG